MRSAEATNETGRLVEALEQGARVLERDPAAAARKARDILVSYPDTPEAYRLLALALRRVGDGIAAGAAERSAIELAGRRPPLAEAARALADKALEKAEIAVRAYLRRDPHEPGAIRMLSEIAMQCGAELEAEKLLRRALGLAPGYALARIQLAQLVRRSGRVEEALTLLDEALRDEPANEIGLSFKAAVLTQLRRLPEALATFEALLASHAGQARGWMNYAFLLKTLGRRDDAIEAYRRSLTLDPTQGEAWWGLANLKTVRLDAADIETMQRALATQPGDATNRLHLHFALGKAFGDQRDYASSFAQYAEGNRIRRGEKPYDAAMVTRDVHHARMVQTPAYFAARAGQGCSAPDPIFILGMPRSGSTLLEQILASHPQIEGTEELFDIQKLAFGLAGIGSMGELSDAIVRQEKSPANYLDVLGSLDGDRLRALGESYIETTRKHRATERPFFTDKMPGNWAFVGFIHLILPNAKIIDIRRNPMACGFANFSQHFNWGINFAYNLADIGRYYHDYVRLMQHYDAVMPGMVHRVFYEDLVDDTEREVRRLLDYLGLPFDEACLRFYENRRAVHTPSSEQVRQPISRDAMEKWQGYAAWLGPLRDALGPVLDCYPRVPETWAD